MSTGAPQTTDFKFKWVDENGNETGVFSKRAQFDGETLRLDDVELPVAVIAHAEVRDKYMILQVMSGEGEPSGLLITVPYCAGVKYNLGRGLLQKNDLPRAAVTLEMALDDCSNYAPAYGALRHCYEQLGENDKLADLKRIWDDEQEASEE